MPADKELVRELTSPRFALGIAAIVLGALFLGEELGWFELDSVADGWPILPFAYGAIRFFAGSALWGVYWMAIGGALLVNNLAGRPVDLGEALVPVALTTLGVHLVTRTVRAGGRWRDREDESISYPDGGIDPAGGVAAGLSPEGATTEVPGGGGSTVAVDGEDAVVRAFAFLAGIERRGRSSNFRGGDAIAVMGGCEIDLRGAHLAPGGAVIEVLAFWGGVVLIVPREWEVDCRVSAILGGVDDKTGGGAPGALSPVPPTGPAGAGRPRLVVRGLAIMGGVELKHEPTGRH